MGVQFLLVPVNAMEIDLSSYNENGNDKITETNCNLFYFP
jgi:hypothetical protein